MEPAALVGQIRVEGDRLAATAAAADLSSRVPACPDWALSDLLVHLSRVYEWVVEIVEQGGAPVGRRPADPPGAPAALTRFEAAHAAVVDVLSSRDPESPAWNFRPGSPQTVGWWCRRQALETAVHRFDAESAAGVPAAAVDTGLAREGVDEMVFEMLPALKGRGALDGAAGTLHLHATDSADHPGEWSLDFGAADLRPAHEHSKADTALRGTSPGLFLWLWNRLTPEAAGLEVFGSRGAVEKLAQVGI